MSHSKRAGRPPAGTIPWARIQEYAEAGAPEREITTALGITKAMLHNRSLAERFRLTLAKGHALYRLQLRVEIKKRGTRTTKGAGSVNALALQARNHLEWDRQFVEQLLSISITGARERLRELAEKMRVKQAKESGAAEVPSAEVTPAVEGLSGGRQ